MGQTLSTGAPEYGRNTACFCSSSICCWHIGNIHAIRRYFNVGTNIFLGTCRTCSRVYTWHTLRAHTRLSDLLGKHSYDRIDHHLTFLGRKEAGYYRQPRVARQPFAVNAKADDLTHDKWIGHWFIRRVYPGGFCSRVVQHRIDSRLSAVTRLIKSTKRRQWRDRSITVNPTDTRT